jgi:hypothetical protein
MFYYSGILEEPIVMVIFAIPAMVSFVLMILTIPHMKFTTSARDFRTSFKMFFSEAVLKPSEPLGKEMFFPWKSGNWKGALQQWLVIHLYFVTIISLVFPFVIPVWIFLTWYYWFALTQREPVGLPAPTCAPMWGCSGGLLLLIAAVNFWEHGLQDLGLDGHIWLLLIMFGTPACACLVSSFFVIERQWPVAVIGALMVLDSIQGLWTLLHMLTMMVHGFHLDMVSIVMAIFGLIGDVMNFYLGSCVFVIGWKGLTEKGTDGSQQGTEATETVGKRVAYHDEENPVAVKNPERVLVQA